MVTTPLPIIDAVVRSVCGRRIEHLAPLAGGGMNETYRADLGDAITVVVRIARQPTPWFIDEAHLMTRARAIGVPTAEVLGVVHRDHEDGLLSFSLQEFLPGRSLMELAGDLATDDLERLVVDAGEIMARVHSVVPDEGSGKRHELRSPAADDVTRIAGIVGEVLDPAAAATVERGAEFLRREITTRPTPPLSLAQGDFMPKNLLIHNGAVTGVIDWEFAGAAPPAFDLARWEVSAGAPFNDRLDLIRRGYARVADPVAAEAGLVPAFAIDWMLEMLAWKNPAGPAQFRRCVELIDRYAG